MKQYLQNICNQMERIALSFLQIQRLFQTNKLSEKDLMNETTQPFWQSMRLGKKRQDSKGLTMDVEILKDNKSKTVSDEHLYMHKEGQHLVGNKAMNVIARRTFYKDGKKIFTDKRHEICNISLLKSDVNGDKVACPNCGYVNTISSFIDGCDACNSKFTVQDFETKISGFSLRENTAAMIKQTVFRMAGFLGMLLGGIVFLALIAFLIASIRYWHDQMQIDGAGWTLSLVGSLMTLPVVFKTLVILLIIFKIGEVFLIKRYKKRILQENVIRSFLPNISVEDFAQNLEYKLRNIHLTDHVGDVSVFARCALNDVIQDYKNVVECDMTRLKFLQFQKNAEGYRVDVETELRLTEYNNNRISFNYENLKLTLFGKPKVIGKSVAKLRHYQCPGCASSINVLEGGICPYCGNSFDYSEVGWVIESYKSKRKRISLYKFIKYIMTIVFVLVLSLQILFPMGLREGNIVQAFYYVYNGTEMMADIYDQIETPDVLYDNITVLVKDDMLFDRKFEYITADADNIMIQYRDYLKGLGFKEHKVKDNMFIVYKPAKVSFAEYEFDMYVRIVVQQSGPGIKISEDLVDTIADMENALEEYTLKKPEKQSS